MVADVEMTCAHILSPSQLRYKGGAMQKFRFTPSNPPACSCGQTLQEMDARDTVVSPPSDKGRSRRARVGVFRCEQCQHKAWRSYWGVEGATEWTRVPAEAAAG